MPAVDLAVLERLADELGDRDSVVEIVRGYLDLLPRRLDDLGPDPTDPDLADQRRVAAHTLKSGAQLLGAASLARAAEAVEEGHGAAEDVRREARTASQAWRRWLAAALARAPHSR